MAKATSKKIEKTKKKTTAKKQGKKTAASAKKVKVEPEKAAPISLENPTIYELLHQIAGEHGYTVAKAIVSEELTDEEIAKRTGIRLNLVRRILYDLYDNRVVSYRRVRDENSGWYIYYWKVDPERALAYVKTNRQLLLQKLEEQLEKEKNTIYFSCSNGCPKMTLEEAAENDFKCSRCKGKLEPYDNSATIISLERRIQALREQLAQA
ncbi:MAG: transcription factor E [Candidatus Hadarchaeum sp.]|uniref:transcription factor E n=1 Tax=Candidatus Hadarchaeum sp. TaxID=2883567 RepID=UPI00317B94EB